MKNPLIIILLLFSNCLFAQSKIDSLENLLQNDTKNISLLNEISNAYWRISPEKGIVYANKARVIAQNSGNKAGLAKALQNIGVNHWAKSEYSDALKNLKKSLNIFKEIKDSGNYSDVLGSIGLVYDNLSDYDNALLCYLEALEIAEKDHSSSALPILLNNTSLVYIALKNYEKASEYIFRAIDLSKKQNNLQNLPAYLNNLGLIHENKNEFIKAKKIYQEALSLNIKNNNNYGKTICLYNIGNAEYNLKNYNEALAYFRKSLELSNKIDDKFGVLLAHKSIGVLYKEMKKYNTALEHYSISLKLANELSSRDEKVAIYKNFATLYKEVDSLNKSLNYFEKYALLKDSIYTENSSKQISEMQTKYESEKKEKENELLRKNSEIQNLAIAKQTNLRNSFIGLSILVILMIVILLNRFTIKKKANQILILKNEVISNQRDELKEINTSKDKFFSIISHDLKSPFNAILGYADLLSSDYDKFDDKNKKKFIAIISQSSRAAYALLDNLLTWARSQQGKIELTKEPLNLKKLINLSIDPYITSAEKKFIKLENMVSDEIIIEVDKYTISTSIGNIFNNAIKFTPERGQITIDAISNANYCEISIKDTGIGMSKEQIQQLFRIDKSFSTKGTNNEKGTGLGLILCKEFVEKNGGNIKVESEIGKGSKFIITFSK